MNEPFKPMLAGTVEDVEKLRYPLLLSPKLDGIRAIVRNRVVYSRNMKPIPSEWVQAQFGHLDGVDGELICGDPFDPACFRKTTSAVMTKNSVMEVNFHVFDIWKPDMSVLPFMDRLQEVIELTNHQMYVRHVPHNQVESVALLEEMERYYLKLGYEGVMVRDPMGPYKCGRSTEREGWLLKLKRFMDSEAVVIGTEEQLYNANWLDEDELGYAKRSSHRENMILAGVLGALVVKDITTGVEFNIGTGFTHDERALLWAQRAALPGSVVKYKYFPTGSKDKPRFPVFLGFRAKEDM